MFLRSLNNLDKLTTLIGCELNEDSYSTDKNSPVCSFSPLNISLLLYWLSDYTSLESWEREGGRAERYHF